MTGIFEGNPLSLAKVYHHNPNSNAVIYEIEVNLNQNLPADGNNGLLFEK